MNFKNNKNKPQAQERFLSALAFENDADKLEFESDAIQLDIMHLISMKMEARNMSKRDLAAAMGTSPSFITQLFTCDKKLNFRHLALLQRVFEVKFNVGMRAIEKPYSIPQTTTSQVAEP